MKLTDVGGLPEGEGPVGCVLARVAARQRCRWNYWWACRGGRAGATERSRRV